MTSSTISGTRLTSAVLVPCAFLSIATFVFWQQAFGLGTFVGESDRLNSYLNFRLWEYDSLHALHRVPSWSNTMFGGFPASALHWMNPGTDPIAIILQQFPREDLFQVLGYIAIASVTAACLAAYCYFRELVASRLIAALGGVSYGLSVISLHRIGQVDNAHLSVILLPIAFLAVRRSDNLIPSFVALTLAMTALAFWGFLQEVAYVFFFVGIYVLYRAGALWLPDRQRAVKTIVCFASASAIAILFALPRLLSVAKEVLLVSRTSAFQYYGYPQLLRFFHEGIYGRSFEENRLLGNGMNVHEGLQLVSSTAAVIAICLGIFRPRGLWETLAAVLFGSLLIPLIPALKISRDGSFFSATTLSMFYWACIISFGIALVYLKRHRIRSESADRISAKLARILTFGEAVQPAARWQAFGALSLSVLLVNVIPDLHFHSDIRSYSDFYAFLTLSGVLIYIAVSYFDRSLNPLEPAEDRNRFPHPQDATFHLFAVVVLLFAIVTVDGHRVVYELFNRADFTHSRLSIVLVLALCSLLCIYLNDMKSSATSWPARISVDRAKAWIAPTVIISIGILAWLVNGPALDSLTVKWSGPHLPYGGNFVSRSVLFKVAATSIAIIAIALSVRTRYFSSSHSRNIATLAIAAWILVETITYAHFKIAGAHTWTYPVPFRGFNYLNVPTNAMRPPSQSELDSFAAGFETDKYRAVLIGGDIQFEGSKTPHISSFWQMNSVGGYGTGVPIRLALLPWPTGVQTLRTIEFQSGSKVDAGILAMLNVKYFLEVTPDLYFNVAGLDSSASGASDQPATLHQTIQGREIRYVQNPVTPLPRQFFAESVTGTQIPPTYKATRAEASDAGGQNDDAIIYGDRLPDLLRRSFAEGFEGTQTFAADGPLEATYEGDEIRIKVTPSTKERFVVLNMRFHPDWRIKLDQRDARPFPTNLTMMGVRMTAGTGEISLRFQPLSSRLPARLVMLLAATCFAAMIPLLSWMQRSRRTPQTAKP